MRLVMFYSFECTAAKKQHIQKMSLVEIKMLRWMNGNTLKH